MTFSITAPLPDAAQTLLATATRMDTPCGTGQLVWHVWGQTNAHPGLAPVVLFHGGSGSWTHWLCNVPALVASGRQVLVPDLPGFGDSAVPLQGNDADALPEPLEQGLQLLLGERACELVGFSFGGMVAGFLAERFPARVVRLVIVGAPGLGIDPLRSIRLRAWRHLPEVAQREAVHRGNLAALMLYRPEAVTETALQLHVANVMRDRMKGRRLSRTDALRRSLAQVQCRVDAIYGREDALYRGEAEALATALQQAPHFRSLTWIEDAGHWVQFERHHAFDEALRKVLRQSAGVMD
ncbi:alpha/beta fold hydrolase [Polaromonas jejuensis]|uniref:Alpha/beta fold hydrolase n=1 Tax=Polaromonas jejuensis TaxID=457502 RepID=A0ABW0QIS0_9BURK|nr:alpha/beta fold hydrolase [Polaromonas jejuensis]